jgi:branched-chain amino acid aminotransferase
VVVASSTSKAWPASAAVTTVPWRRNEHSAVAGLKTTSYAENVVALAYAHEHGGSEAIFANTAGHLCEGTGSNVFVAVDGALVTPPLASGCLAGVTRELLLGATDLGIEEVSLPLDVLGRADEVFITSSTRDVQPVHAVDGAPVPSCPGPLTTAAMKAFHTLEASTPDP